jgi:lipopolysaccharide biosynthesis glycosyltransferase
LNQTLRGKFKPLDYRWNFFSIYPDLPASAFHMNTAEFEEVRRRPSIIHFVSIYKPWFYRWEPHYKKLYSEALAFTPWRGYRPPDRTAKSIVLKTIKMKRLKERLSWHAPGLARGLRQVLGIKT